MPANIRERIILASEADGGKKRKENKPDFLAEAIKLDKVHFLLFHHLGRRSLSLVMWKLQDV